MHSICFTVVDCDPVRINLRGGIRRPRIERRLLILWNFGCLAVELRCRGLIKSHLLFKAQDSDGFKDAQRAGLAVFLAGLRPEVQAALERIGVAERLGEEFIFPEQEKTYSATLDAIRAAYDGLEDQKGDDARAPA